MGGGAWLSLGARSARAQVRDGTRGARALDDISRVYGASRRWVRIPSSYVHLQRTYPVREHCDVNWRDPLLRLLLIRMPWCAICSFYYDRGRSRAQLQLRNGDVSRGPATRTTTYRYRDWDSEAHARSRLVSYRTGRAESFVLADDAITFCAHANARRRIALGWRGRPWEDQVKGEGTVRVGRWESAKTPGSAPASDAPRLLFVLPHFVRGRSPGGIVNCMAMMLVNEGVVAG